MFGLKISVWVQTFRRVSPVLPCNFCHPAKRYHFLVCPWPLIIQLESTSTRSSSICWKFQTALGWASLPALRYKFDKYRLNFEASELQMSNISFDTETIRFIFCISTVARSRTFFNIHLWFCLFIHPIHWYHHIIQNAMEGLCVHTIEP